MLGRTDFSCLLNALGSDPCGETLPGGNERDVKDMQRERVRGPERGIGRRTRRDRSDNKVKAHHPGSCEETYFMDLFSSSNWK